MFSVLVRLIFENYILLWNVVSLEHFGSKLSFCFLIDLLVVIICCSRSCLLKENMKFSNLCGLFVTFAVTRDSVAIAFVNSSCCVCNSIT